MRGRGGTLPAVLDTDTDHTLTGSAGGLSRSAARGAAVGGVLVRLDGDQGGGGRGDGARVTRAALVTREHELAAHTMRQWW